MLEYIVSSDMYNFPAWSGGKDTLNKVIEAGKTDELEDVIKMYLYDGTKDLVEDVDINDFLWFESDLIYESLGLNEDGELIKEEE